MLGTGVQLIGIVRREKHRKVPLEAVFHALCPASHGVLRPNIDRSIHVQFVIESGQEAAVASAIDNAVVRWVRRKVRAFPSCRGLPMGVRDVST